MSAIKIVMVKCGCSVGEVTLNGCDNFRNMIPDLVLTCFNICDGYGYSEDQVAQEWCNISNNFNRLLEVHKDEGIKYWSIDLLLVDGFINIHFINHSMPAF